MTKSERMKPVQRIAETREQAAARELGQAQRYLQEQQGRLDELCRYRSEYSRQCQEAGSAGISVARFRDLQQFLANLDRAITQQEQVVAVAQQTCQQKMQFWQAAHGRTLSLDKVVAHYQAAERRSAEQGEQKELDERAQRLSRLHLPE